MFGVDNVGVINQRNAPAIWESNISEFPTNNIKGRLLLSLNTLELYVDLINGNDNFAGRSLISAPFTNGNGTIFSDIDAPNLRIDLGGALQNNTTIDLDNRNLTFEGGNNNIIIDGFGVLQSTGVGNGQFLPASENTLQVVVPNTTLYFFNTNSGVVYKVNAEAF